ncbi:MAG TPA: hypothetical protein VFO82_05495 [Steroidobacteraceae bacterium]|nr:hypothetical protein [Steroidobacteraceae bacterium]
MRNLAAALFLVLALSCARHAVAQTAPDSLEYDKAVAHVWGSITSTDNVVRWCTRNVPKSKKPIEKAYRDWKTKFAPLIAEIDARIDRVMNSSGAYSAQELAARKADLLKRGAARYDADLASAPQDQVKRECELLPGYFTTSSSFDLEAHFAQDLALIRARPLDKPLEK